MGKELNEIINALHEETVKNSKFVQAFTKKMSQSKITDQENFFMTVKMLANQEDFDTNKAVLHTIRKEDYQSFINCLMLGTPMYLSYMALSKINEISIETHLTNVEIFQNLGKFRTILAYLDCRDFTVTEKTMNEAKDLIRNILS